MHVQHATAVAEASWMSAVQHLLSQAPVTEEDTQLWLSLLPLISALLGTHAVQPATLHLLALSLHAAAIPVLGSQHAEKGPPSLPLALANHADANSLFSEAQAQLTSIQVTQVIAGACTWLSRT